MASPRDFVFDDQGEMLPSDSAAAAARRKELGTTPKPAVKAKPAVVTKEQLAKSGLSLRDYMNKQQGKVRRGTTAAKKRDDADFATESTRDKTMRSVAGRLDPVAAQKARTATDRLRNVSRSAAKDAGEKRKATAERQRDEATAATKRAVSSFAKGGSVSSASKRADGIAVKGKTRGKVY